MYARKTHKMQHCYTMYLRFHNMSQNSKVVVFISYKYTYMSKVSVFDYYILRTTNFYPCYKMVKVCLHLINR